MQSNFDLRYDVLDSIEGDDRHLHDFVDTGWNRNAAIRALASITDATLRRYYRKVSRDVLSADGTYQPLGPKHNAKVYNIATILGR